MSEDGRERFDGDPGWSETALVQAIARWPGGRAWYRVHEDLDERVRERTVGEMIETAREAGGTVRDEQSFTSVLVQASVTQTLGGLRIDERAPASWERMASTPRAPTPGASRAAATRAGSPQRSSSSADRRRKGAQLVVGRRYAHGRRSLRERRLADPVHDPASVASSSTMLPTDRGSPSRSSSS